MFPKHQTSFAGIQNSEDSRRQESQASAHGRATRPGSLPWSVWLSHPPFFQILRSDDLRQTLGTTRHSQKRTGYLIPSQAEYRFLKKGLLCWFNLCMSVGLVFVGWQRVILIFTWAGRGVREAGWQPDMERNYSPATESPCAQERMASGVSQPWAGLGGEGPPLGGVFQAQLHQ